MPASVGEHRLVLRSSFLVWLYRELGWAQTASRGVAAGSATRSMDRLSQRAGSVLHEDLSIHVQYCGCRSARLPWCLFDAGSTRRRCSVLVSGFCAVEGFKIRILLDSSQNSAQFVVFEPICPKSGALGLLGTRRQNSLPEPRSISTALR